MPQPAAQAQRHSGKAAASLVIGILSVFPFYALGWFLGPTAIALSRMARRDAEADPSQNASLGKAGFITGAIGTALGAIILIFVVVWFIAGATSAAN